MSEYLSLNEVLLLANQASGCNFKQVPRKRIIFQGRCLNGETITLCSPQSKIHPKGFYWVDITQEQFRILNETTKGLIFFRLEGRNFLIVNWSDLKAYLTPDCMRYNANEQNHWKLNIYKDHIKISGNLREMPIKLCHYTPD